MLRIRFAAALAENVELGHIVLEQVRGHFRLFERVADAYRTMIAAAKRHAKFPGMAGIYNEPLMQRYIEMGAQFILSGNDAAFLMASAAQRTGFLRKTHTAM